MNFQSNTGILASVGLLSIAFESRAARVSALPEQLGLRRDA
jgi:hypothetical protein